MGYVKDKIGAQNAKKAPSESPARKAPGRRWPANLAKVIKKAVSISELFTEEDQEENLRVIREAKEAIIESVADAPDMQSPGRFSSRDMRFCTASAIAQCPMRASHVATLPKRTLATKRRRP